MWTWFDKPPTDPKTGKRLDQDVDAKTTAVVYFSVAMHPDDIKALSSDHPPENILYDKTKIFGDRSLDDFVFGSNEYKYIAQHCSSLFGESRDNIIIGVKIDKDKVERNDAGALYCTHRIRTENLNLENVFSIETFDKKQLLKKPIDLSSSHDDPPPAPGGPKPKG